VTKEQIAIEADLSLEEVDEALAVMVEHGFVVPLPNGHYLLTLPPGYHWGGEE
jgi:hypothetical protein